MSSAHPVFRSRPSGRTNSRGVQSNPCKTPWRWTYWPMIPADQSRGIKWPPPPSPGQLSSPWFSHPREAWLVGGIELAGWFLGCALLAYAESLVAAERWATYRPLLPLSGVVVVFFVHAATAAFRPHQRAGRWIFCAVVCFTALLAHHESHKFIAEEQESELTPPRSRREQDRSR